MAADRMRDAVIADSQQFAGITDGVSTLNVDNKRCETSADGSLKMNQQGQVQFNPERADGKSLQEFLKTAPESKAMTGLTGGIQGTQGKFFGTPYEVDSWADRVIEACSEVGAFKIFLGQDAQLFF